MAIFTRVSLAFVVALGATLAAGGAFVSPAESVSSCGRPGYSYAGFAAMQRARAVRADVAALASPIVERGHVAAWVGVGGLAEGEGGSDEWIQAGLATFGEEPVNRLYLEVNRPGVGVRYTELRHEVPAGAHLRIAVRELPDRAGWWAAWVNRTRVSEPVYLPGSSGRWHPIATAETWDGGRRVCNLFKYRFDGISIVDSHGVWRKFERGYRFQDPGYRVVSDGGGFVARSARPAQRGTPTARSD